MNRLCLSAAIIASISLGCAARKPSDYLSEPSGVTIEQAMEQVTNGFQKMVSRRMEGEETGVYQQLGLHAADVTITFNVTGSSTAEGKLFVDLAGRSGPPNFGIGRAGAEAGTVETASRGNQITVHFVNLLFAPNDTVVASVDAHDLHRLRYAVSGKDPGPRIGFPPGTNLSNTGFGQQVSAPAGGAPASNTLPDLPPISTAARNQGDQTTDIANTPAFKELISKLKKEPPATQPATQPHRD